MEVTILYYCNRNFGSHNSFGMFWIHICKIENQPHHQKTFTFRNDTTSHWIRNFFVLCDLIWKWIQKQIDMFFDIGVNSGIIAWNSGINHSDFNHKVFNYRYNATPSRL